VDPALVAARGFAAAWQRGALGAVRFAPGSGHAAARTRFITANLTPAPTDLPTVTILSLQHDPGAARDTHAVATASVGWKLDGGRVWSYQVPVPLVGDQGRWKVAWTPAVVEPSLTGDEILRAQRTRGARGTIVDKAGAPFASGAAAKALIGSTAVASPATIQASAGRLATGDVAGRTGLQASQDAALGGTAGLRVEAIAPAVAPRLIKDFPAVPGTNVTITIDRRVQDAAQQALAGAPKPAALVAIRVSTGEILAVANGPSGADGYNRAFLGHYPPGSTFKIITTWALLAKGITPATPINCPATILMGRRFKNAQGEVLGMVPFSTDFAKSCNTAFISQAQKITSQDLTNAAAALGFVPHDLGVPNFFGSAPVTDNLTEHAVDMIGQGKIEASPLAMAVASASVAAGHTVTPRLVVPPGAAAPVPGPGLAPVPVAQLRDLMRQVVTRGTGTVMLGTAGPPVSGKTGTAEFGTEVPPHTHAWFTGFQGDIAFAVLVEDSGFGGEVAAPIARDFLNRLA
jgi:cell division protein FtsI/penicillin-binding protein 2